MICTRCNADNRPTAAFCRDCGAILGGACPVCGAKCAPENRFCDMCGAPLAGVPSLAGAPARFGPRRGYTPNHLTDRILTSRSAMQGERKQITVLFADIKSSMELLMDRDPEDARRLLDPVIELMMEAVHAYEGIVNQVLGDGIMALFGAPLALEDHALRAGYAALRMLDHIARHGDEVQRRHGIPLQIRVGLNSGDVLVRSIGSDLDMDYTAIGQTTNLAARLEKLAKPGTALCAAATIRLAEGFFETRTLGAVPIRGMSEPVEVFELTGVTPARLRFHAAAARGLTRFVGRREEYEAVVATLLRAQQGHGQLAALVGEPGVGKSRLVWEVTRSPELAGWRVLEASALSYATGTPYLPLRRLLQVYFQVDDRDDATTIREKVTDRLVALDPRFAEYAAPLLALLDIPVQDAHWAELDPPQRRVQIGEAVRRLLLRESQEQPLLVVLEDLHWVDRETEAFLDTLVEKLATARIGMLVNCRPEYQLPWGSKTSFTQLRLGPLDSAGAQELLGVLLGPDLALGPLAEAVAKQTGGNPYFLEESVRTLAQAGVLAGEPGHYRLVKPLDRVEVSPTVQSVVAARVDGLAAEDKRLLQAASVIGPTVPIDLLRMVSDDTPEALMASVMRLREAGFLCESRLYPEMEYAFAHVISCDVAYGSLLQGQRRALHARIVAAMEKHYAERLPEHAERLARHAIQGELWNQAAAHSHAAAVKAAARSAYRDAVAHLEEALASLARLPETPDRLAHAIDLRLALRSSLFPLGQIARDLDNLKEAEALALRLGDRRRLGWILAYMIRDFSILGMPDQSIERGQRALALVPEVGDLELEMLINGYLGSVCFARGDYRRAVDLLSKGVEVLKDGLELRRFGLPGPASVFFRLWLISSLTRLGRFDEAEAQSQEGLRVARQAEQPLVLMVAHYAAGFHLAHGPDLARAIAELERSLDLCRTWKLPAWYPNIASILGYAYAHSGRFEEGEALMRQAIEASRASGSMVNHASEVTRLAEALLLAGRVDEAGALAEEAVELARKHQERGNEALALRLAGAVAVRRGLPREAAAAREHYGRAAALADELGMEPLSAACRAALVGLDGG
jgi:class 3 adenylate cyclase/tetratricopeptide (TPR) repeat protein